LILRFFGLITIWGGGDYQLRSALAAKQIWVAVITIWGTLDSLPHTTRCKDTKIKTFELWRVISFLRKVGFRKRCLLLGRWAHHGTERKQKEMQALTLNSPRKRKICRPSSCVFALAFKRIVMLCFKITSCSTSQTFIWSIMWKISSFVYIVCTVCISGKLIHYFSSNLQMQINSINNGPLKHVV